MSGPANYERHHQVHQEPRHAPSPIERRSVAAGLTEVKAMYVHYDTPPRWPRGNGFDVETRWNSWQRRHVPGLDRWLNRGRNSMRGWSVMNMHYENYREISNRDGLLQRYLPGSHFRFDGEFLRCKDAAGAVIVDRPGEWTTERHGNRLSVYDHLENPNWHGSFWTTTPSQSS